MTTSSDKVPGRGGPGQQPEGGGVPGHRPVSTGATAPKPTVADFLETIYGHGSGYVHLTTLKKQLTAYPCAKVRDLAELIPGKRDVYLSAAVAATAAGSGVAGRIEDADMIELTALWADLDRADEPGHKTTEALWTRDDMRALLDRLPLKPTAIVDSGGGWWAYFALTEPVPLNGDGSGELLLARWARFWQDIGVEFGRHVDSVFNPGRIARAPGSINTKEGVERPAVIKSLFPERRYTPAEIDAVLPAPEPPRPASQPVRGDGTRPGDDYNRSATVGSMIALLENHGFHTPRHVGGRVDLTRPGKSARDGHSVTVWSDATVTFWSSAPDALPGTITLRDAAGASGTYDPFGVYVHANHRGDFEAAARSLTPLSTVRLSAPAPAAEDEFWSARPELEHIRTFAQAQMAAPYAVLAVVLARIICQTPPVVVLPDVIYGFASLNLTVALVADSGGGKGGSSAVAAEAVAIGTPEFNMHTLGTGQGIAHGYGHHEKGATVRHAHAVLFTVEEVDHLDAHARQNGSTTLAELRRYSMGEPLGAMYVDPKRRVEIAAHSYRGAIIVAVQPARAGVILDAADGGTPQRFFWAPTIDDHPPAVEPVRPEPWRWQRPRTLPDADRGLRPIPVCQSAVDAIRQAQRERRDGTGDPLDGHALLTRERIAAALGILNGRHELSEEDWQLSGHLMAISDATRSHIVEVLAEKQSAVNRRRGEFEAERTLIVTEAVADAAAQRVARSIVRHIPDGSSISHSQLRKKLSSRDRGYFDDALDRAINAGQVEGINSDGGTHYRKVEK